MWFGLFVGIMLSFFSTTPGYFSIVTSVLMGAAFFMLFGIVTYAMQRGKRDFTSTSQVVATNYDVVVSFEAANEARRLLHQLPMTQHDASASAGSAGYSQRDYQHQPYQPGPGQGSDQPGQQGHAPQRPAGWNDPYGQRAPESGGQPAGGRQPGNQPAGRATQAGPSRQPAGSAEPAPETDEAAKPAGFCLPGPAGRPPAVRGPRQRRAQAGARTGRLAALARPSQRRRPPPGMIRAEAFCVPAALGRRNYAVWPSTSW